MTAPVVLPRTAGRAGVNPILLIAAGALLLTIAVTPARAQLAGRVGVDSDYQLRGYSMTNGNPAFSAQISYDHPSGFYFSFSGLTELGGTSRFLGGIADAGFAKRIDKNLALDAGVLRSQIRAAARDLTGFDYSEIYAGAYVGPVVARIYYSPDYRTERQSTLYGELEAGFAPLRHWRVSGHVGMLTHLGTTAPYQPSKRPDWRITVARQFGGLEVHVNLSQRARQQYESYQSKAKPTVALGASISF